MKLELKHLAPYLPYGVRFIGKRKGWAHEDERPMTLCVDDLAPNKFEYIKPILRPLSDLTPDEYWKLSKLDKRKSFGFWYVDSKEPFFHKKGYSPTSFKKIKDLHFWMVEFLFKHHFDVFGLIDAGKAIDINSLITK